MLRPASLLPSLSTAFEAPLGRTAFLPSSGACYRALRRLPGQVLHLLEERVFQDAPWPQYNMRRRHRAFAGRVIRARMKLPMAEDPRSAYSRRLEECRNDVAARERRHRLLGYAQLATAAAGAAVVWGSLAREGFSIAWTVVPIAIFTGLLVVHDKTLRALERRRRAGNYFERALARLDGDWAGRGESGERFLDPAHPYAQDLDLFGKGSVFELICAARTHIGEDTLARWLLAPAEPQTLLERNQAVEELRPRIDLREDLAVLAEEAHSGV